MKFTYPIDGEGFESLIKNNIDGEGGFYPIGANNFWHGGIHLNSDKAVRAIADGEIIAYKVAENYDVFFKSKADKNTKKNPSEYSTSFALIKHKYESQNGNILNFYSLYMHLLPAKKYTFSESKDKFPIYYKNKKSTIIYESDFYSGTHVRDASKVAIGILPNSCEIVLNESIVDSNPKEDTDEYVLPSALSKGYFKISSTEVVDSNGKTLDGNYVWKDDLKLVEDSTYKVNTFSNKPVVSDTAEKKTSYLKGVFVYDSKSFSAKKVRQIRKGESVYYVEATEEWGVLLKKKDNSDSFYKPKNAEYIPLKVKRKDTIKDTVTIQEIEFDKIVDCSSKPIWVKGGEIVGFGGEYSLPGYSKKKLFHFEIFSDKEIVRFVKNEKKENGAVSSLFLTVKEGVELKDEVPSLDIKKTKDLHKNICFKFDNKFKKGYLKHFQQRLDVQGVLVHVKRSWVDYDRNSKSYTPNKNKVGSLDKTGHDLVCEACKAIDLTNVDYRMKLYSYCDDNGKVASEEASGGNRLAYYMFPSDKTFSVWVQKEKVKALIYKTIAQDGDFYAQAIVKNLPDHYFVKEKQEKLPIENPHKMNLSTVKSNKNLLWKECYRLEEIQKFGMDASNNALFFINSENVDGSKISGWVEESNVENQPIFNWPKFQLVEESSTSSDKNEDGFCDKENLSPFFKNLFGKLDKAKSKGGIKDGKLDVDEIINGLKVESVQNRVQHLICKHPPEWDVDSEFNKWKRIKSNSNFDNIKELIGKLAFWSKVSTLPSKDDIYHFHPINFVKHMKDYHTQSSYFCYIERNKNFILAESPSDFIDSDKDKPKAKVYAKQGGSDPIYLGYPYKRGIALIGAPMLNQCLLSGNVLGVPSLDVANGKNIWASIWASEGGLYAVNSWDNAYFSFGVFQQTMGVGSDRGELPGALQYIKEKNVSVFKKHIGKYGVDTFKVKKSGGIPKGFLSINGIPYTTPSQKAEFRNFKWALRFRLAMDDLEFRKLFLEQGFKRLDVIRDNYSHKFIGVKNEKTYKLKDALTNDLAQSLILDLHINRPAYVRSRWVRAIDNVVVERNKKIKAVEMDNEKIKEENETLAEGNKKVLKKVPAKIDLENLSDDEGYDIIKQIISIRNTCKMTDPKRRAAKIVLCVKGLNDALAKKMGYSGGVGDVLISAGYKKSQTTKLEGFLSAKK